MTRNGAHHDSFHAKVRPAEPRRDVLAARKRRDARSCASARFSVDSKCPASIRCAACSQWVASSSRPSKINAAQVGVHASQIDHRFDEVWVARNRGLVGLDRRIEITALMCGEARCEIVGTPFGLLPSVGSCDVGPRRRQ